MAVVDKYSSFEHLERANEARVGPAALRRRIQALGKREATLEVARALMEDAESVGAMRVYRFLELVPEIGWARARALLTRHHIYAAKPMRELTQRQRTLLVGELVVHADSLGRRS